MAMIALRVLLACGLSGLLRGSMATELCKEGEEACPESSSQSLLQVTNKMQRDTRATAIPECPSDVPCCTTASGAVERVKKIKYGSAKMSGKTVDLVLDTFRLTELKGQTLPVLLHVHGGGFYPSNPYDRDSNVKRNEMYAKRRFLCIAIMYRLHGWMGWAFKQLDMLRDPMHDTLAAVRYIVKNAKSLDADPNTIMLVGGSAGGMTVTNVGMVDAGEGSSGNSGYASNVSAVISMAGGLRPSHYNYLKKGGGKYKKAADIPPYLGIHSTSDSTVPMKDTLSAISELKKIGVPDSKIDFIELPGSAHTPMFWSIKGAGGNKYLFDDMVAWALAHLDHPLC